MQAQTYHHQKEVIIPAPQAEVFAYLDDQTRLAAHMEKRSMMMLGGRMTYELDSGQGRAVGSVIRMGGYFLGLSLVVVEVVTERTPPASKTWETRGPQRLLIIESYVMAFEARRVTEGTSARVYIDYRLPTTLPGRWLGLLFAGFYARWCVSRMLDGASRHLATRQSRSASHETSRASMPTATPARRDMPFDKRLPTEGYGPTDLGIQAGG